MMHTKESFYFRLDNPFLVGNLVGQIYKLIFDRGYIKIGELKESIKDYTVDNVKDDSIVDDIPIYSSKTLKIQFAYGKTNAIFLEFDYADLDKDYKSITKDVINPCFICPVIRTLSIPQIKKALNKIYGTEGIDNG